MDHLTKQEKERDYLTQTFLNNEEIQIKNESIRLSELFYQVYSLSCTISKSKNETPS